MKYKVNTTKPKAHHSYPRLDQVSSRSPLRITPETRIVRSKNIWRQDHFDGFHNFSGNTIKEAFLRMNKDQISWTNAKLTQMHKSSFKNQQKQEAEIKNMLIKWGLIDNTGNVINTQLPYTSTINTTTNLTTKQTAVDDSEMLSYALAKKANKKKIIMYSVFWIMIIAILIWLLKKSK